MKAEEYIKQKSTTIYSGGVISRLNVIHLEDTPSEKKIKKMRKININNPDELKKFKSETTGFVSSYGFPYRLDDLTDKNEPHLPIDWVKPLYCTFHHITTDVKGVKIETYGVIITDE